MAAATAAVAGSHEEESISCLRTEEVDAILACNGCMRAEEAVTSSHARHFFALCMRSAQAAVQAAAVQPWRTRTPVCAGSPTASRPSC